MLAFWLFAWALLLTKFDWLVFPPELLLTPGCCIGPSTPDLPKFEASEIFWGLLWFELLYLKSRSFVMFLNYFLSWLRPFPVWFIGSPIWSGLTSFLRLEAVLSVPWRLLGLTFGVVNMGFYPLTWLVVPGFEFSGVMFGLNVPNPELGFLLVQT